VQLAIQALVVSQNTKAAVRDRWHDELGEGVISTAIAVLIMALIGLAMWTLFKTVFDGAGKKIESNVNQIG
jgi:hypothetical protein